MYKIRLLLLAIIAIYISACQVQTESLKIVPVNLREDSPVKLSEIAGEINKISLELTDESLIGTIMRVIYTGDYLIIYDSNGPKVLIFDSQGKFIRQIGRKGQGPGEYIIIGDIAFDCSENIIFISTSGNKILCYNIDGVFLHEYKIYPPEYIYFQDGYLCLLSTRYGIKSENGFLNQTMLYRMDKKCNPVDSFLVKSVLIDNPFVGSTFPRKDFVSQVSSQTFFYYPVLTPEPIVRDTLYELKGSDMIPFLKLRFSDEGATTGNNNKTKNLLNIWRSEKFVFANYQNRDGNFYFIHDLKTGRNANMKDGFIDDINQIQNRINIRPFNFNTEMFYYLHTNMKPDALEEPNPTLYIGELKK